MEKAEKVTQIIVVGVLTLTSIVAGAVLLYSGMKSGWYFAVLALFTIAAHTPRTVVIEKVKVDERGEG